MSTRSDFVDLDVGFPPIAFAMATRDSLSFDSRSLRSGDSVVIILFNLRCHEQRVRFVSLFVGELRQTAQGDAA